MARAITRFAANYGVGGRVVTDDGYDSGSLAVLIDEKSPFGRDGSAPTSDLLKWLDAVFGRDADIILLDYGFPVALPIADQDSATRHALRVVTDRSLVIGAGGNNAAGHVTVPAGHAEVLAVGSLGDEGALRPYAGWAPEIRKPDLFMRDQLLGTPLQDALTPAAFQPADSPLGPGTRGSSFSALHAVVAAVLAWSTVPDLTPIELRALLQTAATPISHDSQPSPMGLQIADAVSAARKILIRRALSPDPCSLHSVSAITGLSLRITEDTLSAMMAGEEPEVRLLTRGRLERYELTGAA